MHIYIREEKSQKSRVIICISALQLKYVLPQLFFVCMQCSIYLFCFQILLLHVSVRILWDFFPLFSYFWFKSSKQKQVCTGKPLAMVVNSEQPEVTMFEQLTADNHSYGAAHTTLAMPHHIIMLLRDRV